MWPTFCHTTQGLISGLWRPREHAFQISDWGECDCLRAVAAAVSAWRPCLLWAAPRQSWSTRVNWGSPVPGRHRTSLKLTLAWGIFESLTKLSLDPHCSLLGFPQLPSPSRSPSLRVRLDPSLTVLPASLSSLPLPSQVFSLTHFLHV